MLSTTQTTQVQMQVQDFPLRQFLTLYANASNTLYLNHMEGLRAMKLWIGPIARSQKQPCYIPTCLCTYEIQKVAEVLGEHISVVWQEMFDIWQIANLRRNKNVGVDNTQNKQDCFI